MNVNIEMRKTLRYSVDSQWLSLCVSKFAVFTFVLVNRFFQAAYVNILRFLCQKLLRFLGYKMCTVSPNMPRFRGPRIEVLKDLKYTKEHLYGREILFHVESQVFEKAKSLKSSEDKFR